MNTAHKTLKQLIGQDGFAQLRAHELFGPTPLIEICVAKLSDLDVASLCEEQLARNVRLLVGVMRDTLARRYLGLSVLAFAHILVALDYFVRVLDKIPDTTMGGYQDDFEVVNRVMRDFHEDFEGYKAWKTRMGETW